MSPATKPLMSSTKDIDPALSSLLVSLQPGQRIRITQTVRVGMKQWTTTVTGARGSPAFTAAIVRWSASTAGAP